MDNGAGVREGEDEGEDHATGKKRKKRDALWLHQEVRVHPYAHAYTPCTII